MWLKLVSVVHSWKVFLKQNTMRHLHVNWFTFEHIHNHHKNLIRFISSWKIQFFFKFHYSFDLNQQTKKISKPNDDSEWPPTYRASYPSTEVYQYSVYYQFNTKHSQKEKDSRLDKKMNTFQLKNKILENEEKFDWTCFYAMV